MARFNNASSTPTETRIYKVDSRNFKLGLKAAKEFNGKFNPDTKTWSIPVDVNHWNRWFEAPQECGLIEVTPRRMREMEADALMEDMERADSDN